MDYTSLVRKARSRNIRITKKTRGGRRYLTASELRRKLKRKRTRSKKLVVKRGFIGGLIGGLFGRSAGKLVIRRKGRKGRKGRKCKRCKNRKGCRCKRRKSRRLGRSSGSIRAGGLFALKTIATGAAIQLGSEAAKRALAGQM